MYSYAYDPELDLWAIMDNEGYVVGHEVFKWKAVRKVKILNKKVDNTQLAVYTSIDS